MVYLINFIKKNLFLMKMNNYFIYFIKFFKKKFKGRYFIIILMNFN